MAQNDTDINKKLVMRVQERYNDSQNLKRIIKQAYTKNKIISNAKSITNPKTKLEQTIETNILTYLKSNKFILIPFNKQLKINSFLAKKLVLGTSFKSLAKYINLYSYCANKFFKDNLNALTTNTQVNFLKVLIGFFSNFFYVLIQFLILLIYIPAGFINVVLNSIFSIFTVKLNNYVDTKIDAIMDDFKTTFSNKPSSKKSGEGFIMKILKSLLNGLGLLVMMNGKLLVWCAKLGKFMTLDVFKEVVKSMGLTAQLLGELATGKFLFDMQNMSKNKKILKGLVRTNGKAILKHNNLVKSSLTKGKALTAQRSKLKPLIAKAKGAKDRLMANQKNKLEEKANYKEYLKDLQKVNPEAAKELKAFLKENKVDLNATIDPTTLKTATNFTENKLGLEQGSINQAITEQKATGQAQTKERDESEKNSPEKLTRRGDEFQLGGRGKGDLEGEGLLAGLLTDKNKNGIPDIFEGELGHKHEHEHQQQQQGNKQEQPGVGTGNKEKGQTEVNKDDPATFTQEELLKECKTEEQQAFVKQNVSNDQVLNLEQAKNLEGYLNSKSSPTDQVDLDNNNSKDTTYTSTPAKSEMQDNVYENPNKTQPEIEKIEAPATEASTTEKASFDLKKTPSLDAAKTVVNDGLDAQQQKNSKTLAGRDNSFSSIDMGGFF